VPASARKIWCSGGGNGRGEWTLLNITDISPRLATFASTFEHSVSGRILSLAVAPGGTRLYAGGYSGVWRSDDAGRTWAQMTRPQPSEGQSDVPGALSVRTVWDIAVFPDDPDILFVATGGDVRVTPLNGIYRSVDGGVTWTLVHQFPGKGTVGQIEFAPDNPYLVFAAGGEGIAASSDGGLTWSDQRVGGTVWHVAVGPEERLRGGGSRRRLYAAGDGSIWYSPDGGGTWQPDPGAQAISARLRATGGSGSFAADPSNCCYGGGNTAAKVLAIEPGYPEKLYLAAVGGANGPSYYDRPECGSSANVPDGTQCNTAGRGCGEGSLWYGDFSAFDGQGPARWSQLPGPPVYWGVTTTSGSVYVIAKETAAGYLLFFADESHVHVCTGKPTAAWAWHRLDGWDPSRTATRPTENCNKVQVHPDPHALAVSGDFDISLRRAQEAPSPYNQNSELDRYLGGILWMANDGGVYRSDDGGETWELGDGLATLAPINLAGCARPGVPPALYMGTGDNDDFFTLDGGARWGDPVSGCGDCDPWFADPAQPSRVLSFAARDYPPGFGLFTAAVGMFPDASDGNSRRAIPVPSRCRSSPGLPPCPNGPGDVINESNAISNFSIAGYRPIVLTLATEEPLDDGDYVVIRFKPDGTRVLLRTTALSTITAPGDWGDPSKASQQGPPLPANVDVVQASGGHSSPVFYISDSGSSLGLWKWTAGMQQWQQIVGGASRGGGSIARRWFVDPYNPNLLYIVDQDAVKRSDDGGATWRRDAGLDVALTEGGRYPHNADGAVITEMLFHRYERGTRFAAGPAGVFCTVDGIRWTRLMSTTALPSRPVGLFFDSISDPCDRGLYVACDGRSVPKLSPIPAPVWYPTDVVDVTAKTGVRVNGPLTSWQTGAAGYTEFLAGRTPANDLAVLFWSPSSDWGAIDVSQATPGRLSVANPPAAYWRRSYLPDWTLENLAATTLEGDLVVFEAFSNRHVLGWATPSVTDLSAVIRREFYAPITAWQSLRDGTEHLAGMSTDGELLVVRLFPLAVTNVREKTGQRVRGPITNWQTPDGGVIVEHLAGMSVGRLEGGDLLVFYSFAPSWDEVQFVNVSAKTGRTIAGGLTAWQTPDGPENVEHVASVGPGGEVLVFYWSPRQDWQVVDVTARTGVRVTGGLTSWQLPGCGMITEYLAGRTRDGDLVVFFWAPGSDWKALNLSEQTGWRVSGDPTSWQALDGPNIVQHLAAAGPDGRLLVFFTERLA
jgi:BNR/Asp-box repeat